MVVKTNVYVSLREQCYSDAIASLRISKCADTDDHVSMQARIRPIEAGILIHQAIRSVGFFLTAPPRCKLLQGVVIRTNEVEVTHACSGRYFN